MQAENDITREILHSPALMRKIKSYGFSDKMIAYWLKENDNIEMSESEVYAAILRGGYLCGGVSEFDAISVLYHWQLHTSPNGKFVFGYAMR